MARERHLSKAPIREAVLDMRFPAADSIDLGTLRAALEALDDFSQVHEIRPGSAVFQFSLEGGAQSRVEEGDVVGFRAVTTDGLWVAQLRVDGMTLSRLAPYTDWKELSGRSRPYLAKLLELASPPRVDRLALRYINHFRLPHPGDMAEYFLGLPSFPPPLPQYVSNLLYRATLHDPQRDYTAHITNGLLEDLDPERLGFILDIDAFRTAEFPPDPPTLWETLNGLKGFKNQIFFGLITELNAELHE